MKGAILYLYAAAWMTFGTLVAGAGVLRPELGAYLEGVGTLNPSTEELYATVILPIPSLPSSVYEVNELPCRDMLPDKQMVLRVSKPPWYYRAEYNSDARTDRSDVKARNLDLILRQTSGISICQDYNLSIKGLASMMTAYREELMGEMRELMTVLQEGDVENTLRIGGREKRGLFGIPVIAAARTLGMLAIKAVKYKRMADLRATVARLSQAQGDMKWFVMEQAEKATTFQRMAGDELDKLKIQVMTGREEIELLWGNLTTEMTLLQERMGYINATIIHLTNTVSKLSSHVMTVLRNNIITVVNYKLALKEWTGGATNLAAGKLSHTI